MFLTNKIFQQILKFNFFVPAIVFCSPADNHAKTILKILDDILQQNKEAITVYLDVSNLPEWFHFYKNFSESTDSNTTGNIKLQNGKNSLIFSWKDTFHSSVELLVINQIKRSLSNDGISDYSFFIGEIIIKNSTTVRPLLSITKSNNVSDWLSISRVSENFDEWLVRHEQIEECENCRSDFEKVLSVLIILACSCLFVTVIVGIVAIARNHLIKKRVSKGPYKVLLTATDFVFPQIADSRRVSIRVGITFWDIEIADRCWVLHGYSSHVDSNCSVSHMYVAHN